MLVIGTVPRVIVRYAAPIMIPAAELHIASQGVGKMRMVVGMFNPVHERDVGLAGKNGGKRHTNYGNCATAESRPLPDQ